MDENFPNLGKERNIQVQETQSPKQDEYKQIHTRYTIIKMAKVKESEC